MMSSTCEEIKDGNEETLKRIDQCDQTEEKSSSIFDEYELIAKPDRREDERKTGEMP